jgi:hypothetical protein
MKKKRVSDVTLVGVDQVARVFELTARRVQQLIPYGLPHPEHGKYDLAQCMVWFIRYQNKRLASIDAGGPGKSMRAEREKCLRVDADLKEFILTERRRRLVSVADSEKDASTLALRTRACMMPIAPRIASELTGMESRMMIHALVEKAIVEALTRLAEGPDSSHQIPVSKKGNTCM